MLEWTTLIANGFWIVGLAVLLAGFSYHYWLAQRDARPLGRQLQTIAFRRLVWSGLILVTLGLAATSRTGWEAAIWSLAVLLCIARLVRLSIRPLAARLRPMTGGEKGMTAQTHEEIQDSMEPRAPDAGPARPVRSDSTP